MCLCVSALVFNVCVFTVCAGVSVRACVRVCVCGVHACVGNVEFMCRYVSA